MGQYNDRYSSFRFNGGMRVIPNIKIPIETSDKQIVFKLGQTRLDKLSNTYYNNPYSGWLIMLANPEFGGLEFNIPDASIIRIPFPYETAMGRYREGLNKYSKLYG